MIGYALFVLRYNIYTLLQKLIKPKRREYLMFILGNYPDNFKHGIKAVLDANSLLRYSIGNSCILVRFDSTKNIREIENTFNRIFSGYIDSYFLFENNLGTSARGLNQTMYKHLFDPEYNKMTVTESLDRIDHFISIINKMRSGMDMILRVEVDGEDDDLENYTTKNNSTDIISMEDINPILDKIKAHGIESLTELEKETLNKYANND
jgi:hypothetical protein